MNTKVKARAPAIAPRVLAPYTSPARRSECCEGEASAARARGKLAPHSSVVGRNVQSVRSKSTSKFTQGLNASEGSIGQKGRDSEIVHAVHPIVAAKPIWQIA